MEYNGIELADGSDLLNLDEALDNVKPAEWGEPLPDGKYVCVVESAALVPNKGNNGHHIHLKLRVDEGPYKGRVIWHNRGISTNPTALSWLRRDLDALGYTAKASEMPTKLPEVAGTRVGVQLWTSKRGDRSQNAVLSKLAEQPKEAAEPKEMPPTAEEQHVKLLERTIAFVSEVGLSSEQLDEMARAVFGVTFNDLTLEQLKAFAPVLKSRFRK